MLNAIPAVTSYAQQVLYLNEFTPAPVPEVYLEKRVEAYKLIEKLRKFIK
jgi:hypothetical protein